MCWSAYVHIWARIVHLAVGATSLGWPTKRWHGAVPLDVSVFSILFAVLSAGCVHTDPGSWLHKGKNFRNKYFRSAFFEFPHDDAVQLNISLTFDGAWRGASMGTRGHLWLVAKEVLLFRLQDAGGHRFAGSTQHMQWSQVRITIAFEILLAGGHLIRVLEGIAAAKGLQGWTLTACHYIQYI